MNEVVATKILLFGFLTLGLCGCSGSDAPSLGQVSGTITLDGKPLDHAEVLFQPEKGRASLGETDGEGNYELAYTGTSSGALLGPHKVVITTARDAFSDESGAGNDRAARPEILPARYNSKTTLTAEVEQGSNQIDFTLTSE